MHTESSDERAGRLRKLILNHLGTYRSFLYSDQWCIDLALHEEEAYAGGSGRGRGAVAVAPEWLSKSSRSRGAGGLQQPALKLHVHDLSFSTHDLLLNSEETFPQLSGDLVQLYVPGCRIASSRSP